MPFAAPSLAEAIHSGLSWFSWADPLEEHIAGASAGAAESLERPGHTAPAAERRPILIVDDEQGIVEVVGLMLEELGYSVESAGNGAEALTIIDRVHPALILLDMRMPVLDGWGVAQRLRQRGIHIPIIVMTAAHDAQRWAAEIGAEGYVGKPFEFTELLNVVEQWYAP